MEDLKQELLQTLADNGWLDKIKVFLFNSCKSKWN
jgi:hypothetical protein